MVTLIWIRARAFLGAAGRRLCSKLRKRSARGQAITRADLGIAIALVVAGAIGLPDTASAQEREKKLSFEQAWAKCTPHAQQIAQWNVQARTARGKSCMLRYGYRI